MMCSESVCLCVTRAGFEKRRTAESFGYHGDGTHGAATGEPLWLGLIWLLLLREEVSWLLGFAASWAGFEGKAQFGLMMSFLWTPGMDDIAGTR
jgi:hypothetical protein